MSQQIVGKDFTGQTINHYAGEDKVFVRCSFSGAIMEGAMISDSTFVECDFADADLYWCCAFRARFIRCRFERTDLRGSFDGAAFVDCEITGSNFGSDNLGGQSDYGSVVFIDCEVSGNVGLPERSA